MGQALNFFREQRSHCPTSVGLTGSAARMAEVETPQELDLELVRRVQRGESAAFDVLVRKYQHRIVALDRALHRRLERMSGRGPGHFHPRLPRASGISVATPSSTPGCIGSP
jgi:hypothetical protein